MITVKKQNCGVNIFVIGLAVAAGNMVITQRETQALGWGVQGMLVEQQCGAASSVPLYGKELK